MIVADTNIVSEFMRDTPEPRVLLWAQSFGAGDLTISVVTVEEIDRGLGRLPKGRRRKDLERRWTRLLDAFADTIAIYDVTAAMDQGRPMSLADAQIAGICLAHTATLATRSIKDFAHVSDLTLINPFDHPLP